VIRPRRDDYREGRSDRRPNTIENRLGSVSGATRQAIIRFQLDHEQLPTGDLDEETLRLLGVTLLVSSTRYLHWGFEKALARRVGRGGGASSLSRSGRVTICST